MKTAQLLLVALAASPAMGWGRQKTEYDDWSDVDMEKWLSDHHVPNPKRLNGDNLKSLLASHWSSASATAAQKVDTAQVHFAAGTKSAESAYNQATGSAASAYGEASGAAQSSADDTLKSWSDSRLREFLLENGVIAPKGTRDQLIVTAKKYYKQDSPSATATSWASAASATASQAGEAVSAAYYAALDAPSQAYDFVASTYDDSKDWIYSTWSDNDLKSYLVEKGVIKSDAQAKRDDLLTSMKKTYGNGVDNAYETWSDNRLRDWGVKHGIVKSKTAKSRDELLDLVSKSYYGARDTTYDAWSDNQLRSWLESRGLIKTGTQKTTDEYKNLVADNYYSLRDQAYSAWDDNMLRHWLEKQGIIKTPYEAKRDELITNVKDNWYTANDKVWDTWSDAQAQAYLVKNKIVEQSEVASLRRDQLEDKLSKNYQTSRDTIESNWKQSDMRQWLIDQGYMKSDYQAKKDEILSTFTDKYSAASSKSSEYVSWSDNRIRGWLRSNGVNVPMSTKREELLQQMKENYVVTQGLLGQIQSMINSGVNVAENRLEQVLAILKGGAGNAAAKAGYEDEKGIKGAYKQASRSIQSATASIKAEL